MRGKSIAALALWLAAGVSAFAVSLEGHVPEDTTFDDGVPSPASHLGFELGLWHVSHDQLLGYYRKLAETSPRVEWVEYARSHELRPMPLLVISSPGNLAELETLREAHLANESDAPLVLWQGYSVHGNEASGANAAPLYAYYLAAARNDEVEALLADTIVLIDPALNPDGLTRFATWANAHKSRVENGDPQHREHWEAWPSGRTNHYWFDLNRDWLLLTHPESRGRVAQFQRWRPHVLTDFHEMGGEQTYFFQPGVPDRKHPLTPNANVELTAAIADYHAAAFDRLGQLYFSEEAFDDFYYGKGSTYPDIQGSVGILFEQGSARGQRIDTSNGPVTFDIAVRNQLVTSLSTTRAAHALRGRLRQYRRDFDAETRRRGPSAYVFGDAADPERGRRLAEILTLHGVEVYELAEAAEVDDIEYRPGAAWVVPGDQRQHRLWQAMTEQRKTFDSTVFYDVSSWSFPLAFDLPMAEAGRGVKRGERFRSAPYEPASLPEDAYAYAFHWDHYGAAAAVIELLRHDVNVRVATEPFTARSTEGERRFDRGDVVLAVGFNRDVALVDLVRRVSRRHRVPAVALTTGLTPEGVDLGSGTLRPLKPIRPLLVTGGLVNGYEAGEVWHHLDQRLGLPLTMVDLQRLLAVSLDDYTHVLLVDGDYSIAPPALIPLLRGFVNRGGTLVASKLAAQWVTDVGLSLPEPPPEEDTISEDDDEESRSPRPYGSYVKDQSQRIVGGAIVRVNVDTTHPLAYGLRRETLPVFRNGLVFLEPDPNPYASPLRYAEDLHRAGYLAPDVAEAMGGNAAAIVNKVNLGTVIRLADNPLFRGAWYGTERLYNNALLLSQIVLPTEEVPLP